MNPPSQPAPQTRAFQSWQLVFMATILLVTVAITISTFYYRNRPGPGPGSDQPRRHNGPDADQRRARHPNGLLGRGQPHAHRLPGGLG